MNKEEQEIIESTKEFAKAHNIHYDQMTENMILNAMREQFLLHNVSQQRELLEKWWKYFDEESVAVNCNEQEREEVITSFFNCG